MAIKHILCLKNEHPTTSKRKALCPLSYMLFCSRMMTVTGLETPLTSHHGNRRTRQDTPVALPLTA